METAVRSALLPRLPAAVSVRLLLPRTELLRRLLRLLWLRRLLGVRVTRHDFLLAVRGFLGGARPGDRSPAKNYPRCRHNDPTAARVRARAAEVPSVLMPQPSEKRRSYDIIKKGGKQPLSHLPPRPRDSSGSGSGRPTTRGLASYKVGPRPLSITGRAPPSPSSGSSRITHSC